MTAVKKVVKRQNQKNCFVSNTTSMSCSNSGETSVWSKSKNYWPHSTHKLLSLPSARTGISRVTTCVIINDFKPQVVKGSENETCCLFISLDLTPVPSLSLFAFSLLVSFPSLISFGTVCNVFCNCYVTLSL